MNYKCKKCGEQFSVDEHTKECPHCGTPICEENDASGSIKAAHDNKIKKEADLKALVAEYGKTGASKDINTTVQAWDELTTLPDFNRVWRDFVINAAGAAVARKDKDLQLFLKNHARDFDSKRAGSSLYLSLLQAYPKVGTNNDWDELIRSTQGDQTQFAVLCDSIISYIVKANDKAFAIDIFNLIKAKGTEWADAGRVYIRALLSNDEIASKVLTVQAFSVSVARFAEELRTYCKKYLREQSIAVEQTKVWENHLAAAKARKKRATFIAVATLAVIVVAAVAVLVVLNSVNVSTICFNINGETLTNGSTVKVPIKVTYEDNVNDFLNGFTVTYQKNSGEYVTEPLVDKLVGYNPELIGEQRVTFEFKGQKITATLIVANAQLITPELSQSGNIITWETIAHANYYIVYIDSTKFIQTEGLSCDISTYGGYGELKVTVRAFSNDSKYEPSAFSDVFTVNKLQNPQNIDYKNGKLVWDAVDGADKYEVVVNGGNVKVVFSSEYEVSLIHGEPNDISVTAISNTQGVVNGYTNTEIVNNKLAAVDISTVKYQDGIISWSSVPNAQYYDIYINDAQKPLSLDRPNVVIDEFSNLVTDDEPPKITIISKTNQSGFEQSELSDVFRVATSVKVTMNAEGNALVWDSLGEGFTYNVTVNGTSYTGFNESRFSLERNWNVGQNTVSVGASKGGVPYICETVIVTKLAAPEVTSVSDDGLKIANSGKLNLMYKLGDDDWTDTAPEISTLEDGEHIVLVKSIPQAKANLTLPSEEVEVKIVRAPIPSIEVKGGKLQCEYDSSKYTLVLEYQKDSDTSRWTVISSVDSLVGGASYTLRAHLEPNATAFAGYKGLLSSANSGVINVEKPAAPDVSYDEQNNKLTSTTPNAQFYYLDNGVEKEIENGNTKDIKGSINVYARLNAVKTSTNVLNSDNSEPINVNKLELTFSLSLMMNSNKQCYFKFGGCSELNIIKFTYTIEYLDDSNQVIGTLSVDDPVEIKNESGKDDVVKTITYFANGQVSGVVRADVKKIRVTVNIDGATQTAELNVQI